MTEKKSPVISFKDFSFQYRAQKKPTLTGINLDIYPGEKVLIAGPSGSGKSTLAGCVNGLNPFSNPGECKGTLTVDGVDAPHSSIFELSAHVGTVLQDPDGQFIGLTVGEDIAFALENSCTPQDEMHEITRHAAELVGIESHLDYAPHELSGGQKQRVSLAGVMVDQVKILLFDEPLANLDPAAGKQAIELIDEIQKKTDTTVLIIEHRLEDVLWRNVDRIVLVNEGKILADMTPDELLSTSLLADNGIREPLYVTAMRYAGIDITKEKKPAHVDSVVLDDIDRKKLQDWFEAQPIQEDAGEREKLLEVRNLSFGYTKDHQTLRNVSLSIDKGEMVSIVGRNGAGKSTFSKLVCGFEDPDSGEISFHGKDLLKENIRHRAKYIGYVMQNPNQMISKTMIYDEVALSLQKSGMAEAEVHQKVEDTLKICGLYPFRNWPVSALSFGQKKRVTIASVLVQDPELIILDEPTAGQDFKHYTEIMEFLRKLNERGVTVVMITHDMHLMLEYTPRALVFSDGQLIADRRASEVLCDPELIESSALVLGILLASILVKVYMFYYNRSLSKKLDSAAMKATSVDSLSDTVATTLVLIATVISKYTGLILDGWFGILVGIFIVYTGGSTLKETIDLLIGQPPKKEFIDEIREIVLGHSLVYGVHDLIVHDYGPGRRMISLHAEVAVDGDIQDIHEQIDHIEHELQEKLNCSATIHMDPIVTDDKEVLEMKAKVEAMVQSLDEAFSMHDFRMVKGTTRTNLIFDVEVPRKTSLTDNEIMNRLKEQVHGLPGSKYFAVIQIDHEYY